MGSYGEHLDSQIADEVQDRLARERQREVSRFVTMINYATPEEKAKIREALDKTLRRD